MPRIRGGSWRKLEQANQIRFKLVCSRRGDVGEQGSPGIQGPPGEVTTAQLNDAISGTSGNTNTVATLDTPFADPDAESMRLRFNEFLLAARR